MNLVMGFVMLLAGVMMQLKIMYGWRKQRLASQWQILFMATGIGAGLGTLTTELLNVIFP